MDPKVEIAWLEDRIANIQNRIKILKETMSGTLKCQGCCEKICDECSFYRAGDPFVFCSKFCFVRNWRLLCPGNPDRHCEKRIMAIYGDRIE